MSETEPVVIVPAAARVLDAARPDAHLISAVHALYRACHRQPPAVLVAASADDFVRMLAVMSSRPRVMLGRLLLALSFPCLILAILSLAWARKDPGQLAETGAGVVVDIYIGACTLLLPAFANRLPSEAPFPPDVSVSLLVYATGAAGGILLASRLSGNEFHLLFGAVAGTACAVLTHYVGLMLWGIWSRWRLGRREGVPLPLAGDHAIHDVIEPRLRSAGDEVIKTRPLSYDRAGRRLREESPAITESMRIEGVRHSERWWRVTRPLLGPVTGGYGVGRYVCGLALARVSTVDRLPVVLRAAVEIDTRVDAASFLAETALLLPSDAPLSMTGPAAAAATSWRRGRRPPYCQVLAACNATFLRRLAIELATSPEVAERLLAGSVVRQQDAFRRQTAINAMGEARLIAAAGIGPIQRDEFGELYLIGPEQNPLAYVKVRDASPGVDGLHQEHWLSVPPHVATAREAVAWTFAMNESAYRPTAET